MCNLAKPGQIPHRVIAAIWCGAQRSRQLYCAGPYAPGTGRRNTCRVWLALSAAVRTWTGFRAATPDKLPLIGPSTGDRSIFLATGHEGLGITTSLATARLLADQITGTTSEIPIEPYLPSPEP